MGKPPSVSECSPTSAWKLEMVADEEKDVLFLDVFLFVLFCAGDEGDESGGDGYYLWSHRE
jgi:hypothetical protein